VSQKTIKRPAAAKPGDETEAHNRQLLRERAVRLEANRPELPDLGLALQPREPETAAEFMDEFDKKAFGYGDQATITKIIWGPDPLVDNSPAFRDMLDRHGREDLAGLYAEAIIAKGAAAMPDPLMAKSLTVAINRFGREQVAAAFRDRVLKIPYKTVEIDASDELDPEIRGSAVLAETVRRYERPGMMYRFFTQLCVDRMGWRGYTPVRENGDIVRCGTLMLGEVRREVVERRRLRLAEENREKLASVAQSYGEGGEQAQGVSALQPGEQVTARAGVGGDDRDGYLGQTRGVGLEIGRQEI
jgi:hypothetical protein